MTGTERQRQQETIKFWYSSALRDRGTARSLFDLKHFDWCLFIYHLSLEKLLKAAVVLNEATPPPIHDLERLAELARLSVSDSQRDQLAEITNFNIEARYPSEKKSLYEVATVEFTEKWKDICEELFLWVEKQLTH